jgi:hypothetical protein
MIGRFSPALAATCTVPGSHASIQAAINDGACDTINLSAQSYNENLNVARSLTLQGAGQLSTIINGGGASRVITITGSSTIVHLRNLRLTGGNATNPSAPHRGFGGGALVADGATLHGQNLYIDNNIANTAGTLGSGFGGGLAIRDGSAYLTGTIIYSNVAKAGGTAVTHQGQGGGLYAAGNLGAGRAILSLVNSQILSNTAYRVASTARGAGGGLYIGDSDNTQIILSGNIWQGNIARSSLATAGNGEGGAITINPTTKLATVTIADNTIRNNIANASNGTTDVHTAKGGGIFVDATNPGNVSLSMTNITLTQNIAKAGSGVADGQGGAIYAENANITFTGGTVSGNKAGTNGADTGDGGGIRLLQAPLTATRLLIHDNVALENGSGTNRGRGGGIALFNGAATAGALSLTNSIIADNLANTAGSREGAQIYLNDPNLAGRSTLVHVTLAAALPQPNEALFVDSGHTSLTNTIVTSHTTGLFSSGGDIDYNYVLFFGNSVNNAAGSPPPNGGPNLFSGNPLFVNPAARNYHITATSPAKNVGVNANVTNDIDNQTRDTQPDLGADEWVEVTGPPPEEDVFIYLPLVVKKG